MEKSLTCQSLLADLPNIMWLLLLYFLQGVPLGLSSTIPYLLQQSLSKNYSNQATFSLVYWPFSIKLLWAPIVDAVYIQRIGRRKTWIMPIQYFIGIMLLFLAVNITDLFGQSKDNPWAPLGTSHAIKIPMLTTVFFILNFLSSTQDIVVDGWALTMLSKKNVGLSSTCNTVGQNLGNVIAFATFYCFPSPYIANTYLRSKPVEGVGLIKYSSFLYFWGILFICVTTAIGLFKHESGVPSTQVCRCRCFKNRAVTPIGVKRPDCNFDRCDSVQIVDGNNNTCSLVEDDVNADIKSHDNFQSDVRQSLDNDKHIVPYYSNDESPSGFLTLHENDDDGDDNNDNNSNNKSDKKLTLVETYFTMIEVLKLKPILKYVLLLFTCRICFSAMDRISVLKIIDEGFPAENLVFISLILMPIPSITPLFLTKWTNGCSLMTVFSWISIPFMAVSLLLLPIIYLMPYFQLDPIATILPTTTKAIDEKKIYSWIFYLLIYVQCAIKLFLSTFTSVTQIAYHARISDPNVGGTYMTLLNTAANMAAMVPATIILALVEPLTFVSCRKVNPVQVGKMLANTTGLASIGSVNGSMKLSYYEQLGTQYVMKNATCRSIASKKACEYIRGQCHTYVDGFYMLVLMTFIFYLITFPLIIRPIGVYLDRLPLTAYVIQSVNLNTYWIRMRTRFGAFLKTIQNRICMCR